MPVCSNVMTTVFSYNVKAVGGSYNPFDETYKRLYYCRFADDFIIGIIGSYADAENIRQQVRQFIQETLKLTIAEEKSHICHSKQGVLFLGYEGRTRKTTLAPTDVSPTEKNAHSLCEMSSKTTCRNTSSQRVSQADVEGEPDALKGASPVLREGARCSYWDICSLPYC